MNATLYMAMLTHRVQRSTVGLPEGTPPVEGRPLHLSLHTRRDDADRVLWDVLVAEWDRELTYGYGPSSGWSEASLRQRMADNGYTATVTEQEVIL